MELSSLPRGVMLSRAAVVEKMKVEGVGGRRDQETEDVGQGLFFLCCWFLVLLCAL